jgi:hypothetical protein
MTAPAIPGGSARRAPNLSTWLTVIAGSAILLLAYHLVIGRTGRCAAHR